MKKNFFVLTGLILILLTSVSKGEEQYSLSLRCEAIPRHADKICIGITPSPYGPYEDAVYYRKSPGNELTYLRAQTGGVGIFAGFGFSEGGKYLWESWAEEGHPSFSFHQTKQFLSNSNLLQSAGVIGDYYFDHIVRFKDDGVVGYAVINDSPNPCAVSREMNNVLPSSEIDKDNGVIYCIKYIFLNK